MPDPQTDALIDQWRRTARFWKFLALATLAALVLSVAGLTAFGVVQASRARAAEEAARVEAEKTRQKADEAQRDRQAAEDKARQEAEEARQEAEQWARQDAAKAQEESRHQIDEVRRWLYVEHLRRPQQAGDEGPREGDQP